MPKRKKKAVKAKIRQGRPRKYANKTEKYVVYNKKRPTKRVTSQESDLIDQLRKDEKEMERLIKKYKII